MMHKMISLMILISAAFLLPASDKTQLVNAASQALHIGGYYETNVAITTDPIYLSDDSAQGMPFNLLSEDVSSAPGRPIASWSAVSNAGSISISVQANDLVCQESPAAQPLGYNLRFYYTSDGLSYDFFDVQSGSEASVHTISSSDSTTQVSGRIRFYLPEDREINDSTKYPDGNYSASVTLTIEETV